MVDVGKREDRMLDVISALKHNREQTRAALEFYTEAHLIPAEVSSHLCEILTGVTEFEQEAKNDDLVPSGQPER